MTQRIDFVSRDGSPAVGELALPAAPGKHPAIVVVHEWWGLNDDIRRICERFAEEGIVALAIDMYAGRVTEDAQVAMQLVTEMKTLVAIEIVAGAVERLSSHPRCDGRVAVTGFCVGGAVALTAACRVPGLAAAIGFYGVPRAENVDWTKPRCPVVAHFGKDDGSIPLAKVDALVAAMRAGGTEPTVHLYDAGHAFMRARDPKAYDEAAAKVAWARTLDVVRAM